MNDRRSTNTAPSDADALAATPTRKYAREAPVVADIAELLAKRTTTWVQEAEERSPESVVHLIRASAGRQDVELAWRLIETLLQRIPRYVLRRLSKWGSLGSDDRDDVMGALTCRIAEEWLSLDPEHEFWEARFWLCLNRRLLDCIRSTAPWVNGCAERPLGTSGDDEEQETSSDPTGPSVEDRAVALAALSQLPEEMRRVVWLKYHDGCTDDQIGAVLGVTGRTVRNHLARARRALGDDMEEGASK